MLARACAVLTDWESAYRGGQLPPRTAHLYTDPNVTVDALLAPPRKTASAGHDVAAAAVEFRRLVEHVIADETGQPTARLATRPPAQA